MCYPEISIKYFVEVRNCACSNFTGFINDEKQSIFPQVGVQAPQSIVEDTFIRKFEDHDYQTKVNINHIGDMMASRDAESRRNGVQIIKTRKPVVGGEDDCAAKKGFNGRFKKNDEHSLFRIKLDQILDSFKSCFYG